MKFPSIKAFGVVFLLGAALLFAIGLQIDGDGLGFHGPMELMAIFNNGDLEAKLYWNFRLPRVFAAVVIGAGLAAAGTGFQAVLRNPLAEPYTLGVSSGSALAAVIAIRLGLDQIWGHFGVGLLSLLGAWLTIYFVWKLAKVNQELPAATLLLAGIAIAMFSSAASLAIQYTADLSEVYRIVRWMMGGLVGVSGSPLLFSSLGIILSSLMLFKLSKELNALSGGSELAASLGVDVYKTTTLVFALGSIIVGLGISLAGPIGFVGLIVPHTVRMIFGSDHRVVLPISMLGGAVLLLVCDCLSRIVLWPAELPVGILTALLGGPFFLWLLLREKKRGHIWGQ